MLAHTHKWLDGDSDCHAALMVGGRVMACHARRCAAPQCTNRNAPPGDYCKETHFHLGRRLVLPSRGADA